jgi:hypothetical protein
MMKRFFILPALLLLLSPAFAHAQTVESGRVITLSTSTPANAYLAGGQVTVNAALPADLCAAAGTITVTAPIAGDALLAGGTVELQKPVNGDARIAGGRVLVDDTVKGDLMAVGGLVTVSGKPTDAYIGGGTVEMTDGANGPVTIYGADVYLSGEFYGNVNVVASDRVSLADNTVIHGSLRYNAPEQAEIPSSANITGGVAYTGAEPYLPTPQQAKTFALAGFWVFILVRITAALVATGLIAGIFPMLTDRVVESTLTRSPERFILLGLLGFGGFVVAPILFILLVISFVGIGVSLVLGAAYLLFLLLAYIYGSVLAGAIVMRWIFKNTNVTWRTAILGVIILYVVGIIPYIGTLIRFILEAAAGGSLLLLAYRFAFSHSRINIDEI